jgi:hypothetical protein
VIVACETGVPAGVWLAEPRTLMTAARYLTERSERIRRG